MSDLTTILTGVFSGAITFLCGRLLHDLYTENRTRKRAFLMLTIDVLAARPAHKRLPARMLKAKGAIRNLRNGNIDALSDLLSGYVIAPPTFTAKDFLQVLPAGEARLAARWMERRLRLVEIERRYYSTFRDLIAQSKGLDAAQLNQYPWKEWCTQLEGHLEDLETLGNEMASLGAEILKAAKTKREGSDAEEADVLEAEVRKNLDEKSQT